MTREQGIERVYEGPRHVVILGAGASIASTIRDPELYGKRLPSMDNFVEVVSLEDVVEQIAPHAIDRNFEAIYSQLYAEDPNSSAVKEIEARVRSYFSEMELPSTPTIYDYLVLSLRSKDLIVTFNWDPFLYQAFCRNSHVGRPPSLSFLHGSVSIGYSIEDDRAGPAGMFSVASCSEYVPTRLLYPVAQKDYNKDPFIKEEWERLKYWLEHSKRVTIFGYGAPDTDVEAVELMSGAWGDPSLRDMEQIEVIDTAPREMIRQRWDRFIHGLHYDCCTDYFNSVLANFPRRTGERFVHQFSQLSPSEALQEPNKVPQDFSSLEEMWNWFEPLIEAEEVA